MKTGKYNSPINLSNALLLSAIFFICDSCELSSASNAAVTIPGPKPLASFKTEKKPAATIAVIADAASILARQQVPVLCYHQIRDLRPTDSKTAKDYIVPVAFFKEQMKILADSGYHTILPDQLYDYLINGRPLPSKPFMLTFDDTKLEQYSVALTEMNQYGFKGVFFIMTVSLGRPNYMNKEQVKELADAGNVIGSHTWDHHNVKKYHDEDWVTQIEEPSSQLEEITGKTVNYFAYPFGLWNAVAFPELKKRGFKAAFQLSAKRDELEPMYTIRRIIVPGSWNPKSLLARMKSSF